MSNLDADVKAAIDADTALYEELKAKYGLHPAATISECANLVALVQRGVPIRETVENLLTHVIKGFDLDRAYIGGWITRAIHTRTVLVKRPTPQ